MKKAVIGQKLRSANRRFGRKNLHKMQGKFLKKHGNLYRHLRCQKKRKKRYGRSENRGKTITSDNGMEFAQHLEIAKQLSTKFYFARPYHSWERGISENTNGLIRQYFPKSRNLLTVTQKEIQFPMDQLNTRPRKRLKYLTPSQAFTSNLKSALRT